MLTSVYLGSRTLALVCLLTLWVGMTNYVQAAGITTRFTYPEELKKRQTFVALDENLFGDTINLQDGTVRFAQTDVVAKANFGIPMTITRKTQSGHINLGLFGSDWMIDVPYMVGTYDVRTGWNTGTLDGKRCSTGLKPPISGPALPGARYLPQNYKYWHGVHINLPGVGEDLLLKSTAAQTMPSDGATYVGTTKSEWRVACLPALRKGTGEGFTVKTTEGVTYYFDWLVARDAPGLQDFGAPSQYSMTLMMLSNVFILATKAVDRFGNTITYTYDANFPTRLKSIVSSDGARIDLNYNTAGLISSVVSGSQTWNYIYVYGGQSEDRLKRVVNPDGGDWIFNTPDSSPAISTGWLTIYAPLFMDSQFLLNSCIRPGAGQNLSPGASISGSLLKMKHPSGARGEFQFRPIYQGTNQAPTYYIINVASSEDYSVNSCAILYIPSVNVAISLLSKKISGPGIQEMAWNYVYDTSWSFHSHTCNGVPCPNTSRTIVSRNDGVTKTFTFGNGYSTNLGQLLSQTVEQNGAKAQEIQYEYISTPTGQPFPTDYGLVVGNTGAAGDLYSQFGNPFSYERRPLKRKTILQDGDIAGPVYTPPAPPPPPHEPPTPPNPPPCPNCNIPVVGGTPTILTAAAATATPPVNFTSSTLAYDKFARPLKMDKWTSGALANVGRTDITEYYDEESKWVLGQIKRQVNINTGLVESQIDYWPGTALPQRTWRFGKPQQYFVYNLDGTLATVTDGNNNTTTLSDWYRGVPRAIRFPPTPEAPTGSTQSAVVDDNGWIISTTDENGFTTNFGYDPMGRLNKINYPAGDSTAYHEVTMAFQPVNADEHGLPAGHWRQSRYEGNKHVNTYYDALWRPVLEEALDAGDIGGTVTQTVKRYDESGRLIFQSYPQRGVGDYRSVTQGVHTIYDALDRPTSVSQDSEHGLLTTITEYLPGLQTRVTNPRGQKTLTTYQAYDQPTYDWPVRIEHPEGAVTDIARDVFGKPLETRRK